MSERTKRYAIIIEHGPASYGAYAPDVPGCAVVGETEQEVRQLLGEALAIHFEGLRARGEQVPEPLSSVGYVKITL